MAAGEAGSSLRLLFPPPDAVLQGDGPVLLRGTGGRRSLTFLVDGAPVPGVPAQRQASWVPGGAGVLCDHGAGCGWGERAGAGEGAMKIVDTPVVRIASEEYGSADFAGCLPHPH
jgi:hypothetical protein